VGFIGGTTQRSPSRSGRDLRNSLRGLHTSRHRRGSGDQGFPDVIFVLCHWGTSGVENVSDNVAMIEASIWWGRAQPRRVPIGHEVEGGLPGRLQGCYLVNWARSS
jgi:hypothetical protein